MACKARIYEVGPLATLGTGSCTSCITGSMHHWQGGAAPPDKSEMAAQLQHTYTPASIMAWIPCRISKSAISDLANQLILVCKARVSRGGSLAKGSCTPCNT
jgi:hypothetical protein